MPARCTSLTGAGTAAHSSFNVQVYHTDGLGSVRAITNGSGTLIQTYQTDEFGIPTSSQGTSTQPFGFTGQQADGSGLIYLRARYYDPATGRFLSRDTAFGNALNPITLSRYLYARSNPLLYLDLAGHFAIQQAQALCAAEGLSCENLTHDMAVELLNGNAREVDWTDSSVLTNGSPVDVSLFVLSTVGTGGDPAGEREIAGVLEGFTKHGLLQVINRGVRPYEIMDALRNPVRVVQGRGDVVRYVGQWAELRLNSLGRVVTALRFKPPDVP